MKLKWARQSNTVISIYVDLNRGREEEGCDERRGTVSKESLSVGDQ